MAVTRISFSYPKKMKEKLLELAEKDCRTLSSYIQRVLADHLEKHGVDLNEKSKKVPKVPKKKVVRRKRATAA